MSSFRDFFKELKILLPNLKCNRNMTFKNITTFKIGGKIKAYIEVKSVQILLKILNLAKKHNIEYFILGNGSNILASNKLHNILVIKVSLNEVKVIKNKIIAGAGVNIFTLNMIASANKLTGLEWSYGIPGTVGGAVKMNAGSFNGEMKDVIECVYYTDGQKIYKKNNKSLRFAYRSSYFSRNNYVILKAVFNLKYDNFKNIEKCCMEYLNKRKLTQPYENFSAGSVFKKPENNYAPVLIEKCNLKGYKYGYAQVSNKHCGFIVNLEGKATFNQVFKIISKIKKTVYEKFDIILVEEICIIY